MSSLSKAFIGIGREAKGRRREEGVTCTEAKEMRSENGRVVKAKEDKRRNCGEKWDLKIGPLVLHTLANEEKDLPQRATK